MNGGESSAGASIESDDKEAQEAPETGSEVVIGKGADGDGASCGVVAADGDAKSIKLV